AHDANGAMGLVINHTLPGLEFEELVEQLGITSDIEIRLDSDSVPVMSGGPVEAARGFVLHSGDFSRKDTVKIDDLYSVTGTVEALKDIATGNGPDNMLFILGYAGWSAGQLDSEMQQNAWLVVDPDPSLIFHANPDKKWDMAIEKLGIDPLMLSSESGRA
ncbi:MAG TPA: hypothetical protein DEA55_07790, partial [Rhodospirillaceae bacterium]|nr:hypothetical protein [Rhodospirillaceae bacterium]